MNYSTPWSRTKEPSPHAKIYLTLVGGFAKDKDGGLGLWAYRHIHGFEDDIFKITPLSIDINDTRALHVAQLTRDALAT
jgi:hypothetical protein